MSTHRSLRSLRRPLAAIAGLALLALPLSACGGDDAKAASGAPKPVAVVEALSGESTAIKLDQGFVDALGQLKLTPGTTGGGKLTKDGSLVFPITGGSVGLYTTVRLSNFNVDPGVSRVFGDVAVNGKTAVTSAYLFKLDGRTLKPLQVKGGTAVLTGTKVEISDVAAPLLNKTFKTKAVQAGLLVGIATITVNTK